MGFIGKEQRAPEAAAKIGLELSDAVGVQPVEALGALGKAREVRQVARWATTRLPLRTVSGKRSAHQ